MDRITGMLIDQLRALAEGHSILVVALTEAEARQKGRMILRSAKALGIRVRGRTRDLDAPAIRLRAFEEPPNVVANAYHGVILPSAVFERGRVRETTIRSTIT